MAIRSGTCRTAPQMTTSIASGQNGAAAIASAMVAASKGNTTCHRRGRQAFFAERTQVVGRRIVQRRQRELEPLADVGVGTHLRHQRLEGLEVIGERRGPQAMVERLLADRALGAVEQREHGIEMQVVARPIVERRVGAALRDADAVILRDERHRPRPIAGPPPGRPQAATQDQAGAPSPGRHDRGGPDHERDARMGVMSNV